MNLTAVAATGMGYLTVYAGDEPTPPLASHLNFSAGQTRASNAIVRLASDGTGTLRVRNGSSGAVHLVLDVNGFFQPAYTASLVLSASVGLLPHSYVLTPFSTSEAGRLDLTVDWSPSSGPIEVHLARGECSLPEFLAGTCDFLTQADPPMLRPLRVFTPSVSAGSFTLIVGSGEESLSVAMEVILRTPS